MTCARWTISNHQKYDLGTTAKRDELAIGHVPSG